MDSAGHHKHDDCGDQDQEKETEREEEKEIRFCASMRELAE